MLSVCLVSSIISSVNVGILLEKKKLLLNHKKKEKKYSALPGNRTRVARMGILHDTTTPAVPSTQTSVLVLYKYQYLGSG